MGRGARAEPSVYSVSMASVKLASLLLVGLFCATGAQKKPSSLHQPGAAVRITHRHELVTECRVAAADGACVELRVKAPAGVDLLWAPISDPLISTPTEDRSPIRLSLPPSLGLSSIDARIPAGAWQFSWSNQRAALRVPAGGRMQVRLSTISGRCVRQQLACKLDGDATRRETQVPPEYALAN